MQKLMFAVLAYGISANYSREEMSPSCLCNKFNILDML